MKLFNAIGVLPPGTGPIYSITTVCNTVISSQVWGGSIICHFLIVFKKAPRYQNHAAAQVESSIFTWSTCLSKWCRRQSILDRPWMQSRNKERQKALLEGTYVRLLRKTTKKVRQSRQHEMDRSIKKFPTCQKARRHGRCVRRCLST